MTSHRLKVLEHPSVEDEEHHGIHAPDPLKKHHDVTLEGQSKIARSSANSAGEDHIQAQVHIQAHSAHTVHQVLTAIGVDKISPQGTIRNEETMIEMQEEIEIEIGSKIEKRKEQGTGKRIERRREIRVETETGAEREIEIEIGTVAAETGMKKTGQDPDSDETNGVVRQKNHAEIGGLNAMIDKREARGVWRPAGLLRSRKVEA